MTPELAYFLKINVGIALFYAFYRLFLYKDTFFIGGGRHYSAFSGFHSSTRCSICKNG